MNARKKIVCLIAAAFMFIGGVLCFVGYLAAGANLNNMNPNPTTKKSYEYSDSVTSLDLTNGDYILKTSGDDKIHVETIETEYITYEIKTENGLLKIKQTDSRPWYKMIMALNLGWDMPKATVSIPEGSYKTINVTSGSGDLTIDSGVSAEKAKLNCTSGDITVNGTFGELTVTSSSGDISVKGTVTENLSVSTSSGDISVKGTVTENLSVSTSSGDVTLNLSETATGSISAKSSSGDITANDAVCGEELTLISTSGDILFNRCDANTVTLKTTSGDIVGSLLSGKTFSARTSSGDIRIPEDEAGGSCTANTRSGDIIISIK